MDYIKNLYQSVAKVERLEKVEDTTSILRLETTKN